MKKTKLALWAAYLVLSANPLAVFGASDEAPSHVIVQEKKKAEASGDVQPAFQANKSGSGTGMPVYTPPLRGAPAGRVGGGTRGLGDEKAFLLVLAPDHVGLTAQKQPSLYWFLSGSPVYPVEFTLIENKAAKPLVEKRLETGENRGLQWFRLSDHGINLQPDVLYRWFVTLIPDPERRSKDILSGGFIKRIEPSRELKQTLDKDEKTEQVHIYAQAGLWYDAFMVVCRLIETSPDDDHLRQMRRSLLEQVGLDQVARDLK
jgi:hypothetical protein